MFGLPEGGTQQVIGAFQPSSLSLVAVTGTPDGTIYAAGNSGKIIQIAPDGSASEFAFQGEITALQAAGPTLYVVATLENGSSSVSSLPISADGSLGTPTLITGLPAPGTSIAVAADGTLYVGLFRSDDPVVTVEPSGVVAPLYPGVITGPVTGLAYGAGSQLYMVRGTAPIVPGGATPPRTDLFRIETRRDGFR